MPARESRAKRRQRKEKHQAWAKLALVGVAVVGLILFYMQSMLSHRELNQESLCPSQPQSVTVLLVDVTDPMNLPQRQDFNNQLDRLLEQIPRYGKLVVMKVDPVSDRLLAPVITRCNPGSAADVSDVSGNPQKLEKQHAEGFIAPLKAAFGSLLSASNAPRSPILESIQSANLTELQQPLLGDVPKRLIVASDLLQNTGEITFYRSLPDPAAFVKSQSFSRVRTDLRGVEVELWMLQRADSTHTQPRALPDLWDEIITAQGGQLRRIYTVSG